MNHASWSRSLAASPAVVACGVGLLAVVMWHRGGALRAPGTVLAGLLLLQIALGIALVVARQPQLALSIAHDAAAALLLAVLVQLACRLRAPPATVSPAPRVRRE